MRIKEYYYSDSQTSFKSDQLIHLDREIQIEIMREWFLQNYEDPVENTPYDSEDGYLFIWGGPYDPLEALNDEFGGNISEDVIEELADDLRQIAVEWTKPSQQEDSEESYILSRISEIYEPKITFEESIENIESLLKLGSVDPSLQNHLYKLLYVNVITSMETFLSDLFMSAVKGNKKLFRRFVETTPEYQKEKISVSDIFKLNEKLTLKVFGYLMDVVWHHLAKIKPMFKASLDITFPDDLDDIYKAILIRHDIVHRNGKKKEGDSFHDITEEMVKDLIENSKIFVEDISKQWSEKPVKDDSID